MVLQPPLQVVWYELSEYDARSPVRLDLLVRVHDLKHTAQL
jgi:hypothetical protein